MSANENPPITRLTMPEYGALLRLMGARCNALKAAQDLKPRLRSTGIAYRLVTSAAGLLMKALDLTFRTIPADKLASLYRDLDHVVTITRVSYSGTQTEDSYRYVDAVALDHLLGVAIQYECGLCDKTGHDVKKCAFRKLANKLYPFDIAESVGGECSLNGARGSESIEKLARGEVQPDDLPV